MEFNEDVKLTKHAEKQLDSFKEEQVRKLMRLIIADKYYPGLDELEVTSDDIKLYSKQFVTIKNKKSSRLSLIAWIYLIIGIVVVITGFLFDDIREMFFNAPLRLSIVVSGISLILISLYILLRLNSINEQKKRPVQYTNFWD